MDLSKSIIISVIAVGRIYVIDVKSCSVSSLTSSVFTLHSFPGSTLILLLPMSNVRNDLIPHMLSGKSFK